MKKVGILDYSIGNLYSVAKAVEFVGGEVYFVKCPEDIMKAEYLILPGVGAFDRCYSALDKGGYIKPLLSYVHAEKPLLGICVGMQLLFSSSTEGKGSIGLGIINGTVNLINRGNNDQIKLPNIGWSRLIFDHVCSMHLLSGLNPTDEFYFVHSYNAYCEDEEAETIYSSYKGLQITALVKKNNVYGCQFHAEKSKDPGLQIFKNFLEV